MKGMKHAQLAIVVIVLSVMFTADDVVIRSKDPRFNART